MTVALMAIGALMELLCESMSQDKQRATNPPHPIVVYRHTN